MTVTINQQQYQFQENTSLQEAMQSLEIEDAGIALALNEEIIPRTEWTKTILCNADKIIVIGAVAGG